MNSLLEREKARLAENPFINYNHIKVMDVQKDYAELYLDIVPESHNQIGILHGAIYFAMADCCAGVTSRTDDRKYVTQSAQVNFIRPAREGRIFARSKVVHRGHSGCLTDVNIYDGEDNLLFTSRYFFYCVEQ